VPRRADIEGHHTTLKTASDARQRAVDAYPLAVAMSWDQAAWAAESDTSTVDIDGWLLDPKFVADCENAARAASIDGTLELPVLIETQSQLLDKVREAIPDMTWDEAVDALKTVSRLREARDRFLISQRDPYHDLPLVVFSMNLTGGITTTIAPDLRAEVVDVVAKEPRAELGDEQTQQAGVDALGAFAALAGAVPLTDEGDES
jgi:hypothetical protein